MTPFSSRHPARALAVLALAGAAALPSAQASGFSLGNFDPAQWRQTVLTDDGPATLSWALGTDIGNPGQGWLLTYQQPRTFSAGSSADRVANVFTGFSYDPAASGALTALNFSADVRGYSTSFVFAPLGYLRPVIVQAGTVFSVLSSDLTVTLGLYQPQTWSFTAASDWLPVDSITLRPDFSASGAPIQFGLRYSHFTGCNGSAGCLGGTTLAGVDNISVALTSVSPVPEPHRAALLLAGVGVLAMRARRRSSPSA